MDTSKFLENYHLKQRRKKELQCRLRLGLQQLKEKPYLDFGALFIIAVFLTAWFNREFFIPTQFLPPNLYAIWKTGVSILLMVALAIWELLFIKIIGVYTARNDEASVFKAFSAIGVKNEPPILYSKKRHSLNKEITIREFYSDIPLEVWKSEKAQNEIAQKLDIHFTAPYIEYGGGKKSRSRKKIRVYSGDGYKSPERGIMYDDEY